MSTYSNSSVSQSTLSALLLLSVIATLVLVFTATSAGLRGTDQYQYAADAETLRKNQPPLTNLFFPAKIVRNQQVQEDTNYFSHNGPLLHIVAKSNSLIDVQATWILLNSLFHLIIAVAIFLIARLHTSVSIATIVTTLYIASPIAFWQTSNVLQEMFFGALVALGLLCYYFRQNLATTLLLPLCYFIGALSHPIFVLTGLLHGLSHLVLSPIKRDYKLALSGVVCVAAVVSALAMSGTWFPTQFQPGIKEIITSAIPNYSNMVYHFQQATPDISTGLMLDKFVAAINMQFLSLKNAPFFIFTNIAGFSLLYLLYASLVRRRISLYLVAPLAVLFGAYIGIIVLQQNHARFQQIISPATFLVIAFVIHKFKFNITKPLMLVVCLMLVIDTGYAYYLRKQTVLQTNAINELKTQIDTLKNNADFLSIDIREHGALAYTLRPNKLLTINTKLMKRASIESATQLFKPDFILMKGEHEALFSDELSLEAEINNPHFGQLKLYRY